MRFRIIVSFMMISFVGFGQCEKIKRTVDKFTGEIFISTPPAQMKFLVVKHNPIYFTKIIKDGKDKYYLSLVACGPTVNVEEKGVVILFEDGSKIDLTNVEIDTEVSNIEYCRFEYTAFIEMDEKLINKMKTSSITDYRLYIYDRTLLKAEIKQYHDLFECLIKAK